MKNKIAFMALVFAFGVQAQADIPKKICRSLQTSPGTVFEFEIITGNENIKITLPNEAIHSEYPMSVTQSAGDVLRMEVDYSRVGRNNLIMFFHERTNTLDFAQEQIVCENAK